MKKLISFILLLSVLCGTMLFVACNKTDLPTDTAVNQDQEQTDKPSAEKTSQPEAKEFVVGVDDQFAPMAFRDENNNMTGFDIDFLTAVAEQMGYTVKFQTIDWSSKFLELDGDKINVIASGFTVDEERKTKCILSKSYLANAQVIVVKADSTIASKADLKDKIVGVQTDSTAIKALTSDEISKSLKEKIEYPDNVSILNDVKIARLDAAVLDVVVANYYSSKQPGTFKILEESLSPEEYAFGIKKGNTEFATEFQNAIDAINKNGKAAEISNKWFGKDIVLK